MAGNLLQKAASSFTNDLKKAGSAFGKNAKNAIEDIADDVGLGKLLRDGPSSDPLESSFSEASVNIGEKDWRVKLSIPSALKDSSLLKPLQDIGGFVFPYTPTILMSHSANYNALQPIHSNYPFYNYTNSQIEDMVITGDFFVQNSADAAYWVGALYYLRTMTKMFYGAGDFQGNPPPVCKLNGYGDYVFPNVSVIIKNFTVDMPADVDYIKTTLDDVTSSSDANNEGNVGWVPAQSQFAVTVSPIYSRKKVETFSLKNFVNGGYIKGGGGFI